jgi:hypothetical protein
VNGVFPVNPEFFDVKRIAIPERLVVKVADGIENLFAAKPGCTL